MIRQPSDLATKLQEKISQLLLVETSKYLCRDLSSKRCYHLFTRRIKEKSNLNILRSITKIVRLISVSVTEQN